MAGYVPAARVAGTGSAMLLFVSVAFAADSATLLKGLRDPAGWEDVDRKDVKGVGSVLVRYKEIAGENCLEGSTTAAASPDKLLVAAADIPGQPSWSSWKVVASERLGGTDAAFDYVQVLDNPSPVADRFWFVTATVARQGDDRVFTWQQIDGQARYPEAYARVTSKYPSAVSTRVNVGDWTFSPRGAETFVRYRICTDAGGALPRWVGEYAARTTLPTNVADIVRHVTGS